MYASKFTFSAALASTLIAFSAPSAQAVPLLFDDFNLGFTDLNWAGDGVFISVPAPGNVQGLPSTDLIGAGSIGDGTGYDFYPGNGQYVDLDGSTGNGNNPAGELQSLFSFAPGSYTLTFDLAGNARGYPNQITNIVLGSFSVALSLPSNTGGFNPYSYTFATTGGVLRFFDSGPSEQQGNILDNVSVSAVPIPAALPLFAGGLGLLGWLARRRRKDAESIA